MKKDKIKKEKKKRVTLKQRIINSFSSKISNAVAEHDNWLIDKICHRIEILACDTNNNYDLEFILNDIKNKGYLLEDTQRSDL